MSSVQPRRATFRPNGHNSPHPHQSHNRSNNQAPAEPEEIRLLRSKYKSELAQLKPMFPDWKDEDLFTVLNESHGSVETVVSKITEGHAERWDAVPSKKDKKPHQTPGSTGSSSHHYARDRAESGGAASPGRGGFRGVRGGRGGGRGGSSMGRGGFSRGGGPANGRGAGPNDGQGEGTDVGQTIPAETNGDTNTPVSETPSGPGAKGVTSNVESVSETPAVQSTTQEKSKSASIPAKVNGSQIVAPKPTPKAPAVKSWADMARPKPKPVVQPPPPPPAVVAPPIIPVPAPVSIEEPLGHHPSSEETKEQDNAESHTSETGQNLPEDPTAASGDDWVAVSPPSKAEAELPVPEATSQDSITAAVPAPVSTSQQVWTQVATPDAPVCSSTGPSDVKEVKTEQAPTTVVPPVSSVAPTTSSVEHSGPPGLPALHSSAPTPTLSNSGTSVTPSTKPSTPRLAHRAASRFKTDAPVIMPGGVSAGLGTITPTLSFGSTANFDAIPARLGMQFGSLTLDGADDFDIDNSLPVEQPEPEVVEEQHVAPVASEPVVQPEPSPVPQPPAPLPAVAQQVPTQQPTQQSAPVQSSPTASTLSAINLYQQQPPVSQQQQSLPHQVTSTGSHSQLPSQAISAGLGSFGSHQSPAPGLNIASHQQPQLHQPQSVLPQHLQHQTSTQSQAQQQTPQHLGYPSSHQLPHLDTTASTQTPLSHPAVAAQNQYFRQESPYYHVPTPPHSQSAIPQTTQDHSLSHSSPYGAFSPLGQQGQGSHLGAFGSSPAPGDYGSYGDSQRDFYNSYGQGSGFRSGSQLGNEDAAKTGLAGSNQAGAGLGQQSTSLGQNQAPLSATPQQAQQQQQQQFPAMMPYYYQQQPYYMPNQYYPQSNPYPHQPYVKYPPYAQPPGTGAPPPHQQGNKPPGTATAAPYGSQQQTHAYHPGQTAPYEDPSAVNYQQTSNAGADYSKQYGQGIQGFFGSQTPGQTSTGPQIGGTSTQQRGTTGATTSPDNQYKAYAGPGGVGDKQGQQPAGGGQGRGNVPGAPQPQGGYYPNNNRYSNAPQPPAQGYPQTTEGQFYPSYQQQPRGGYWQ